MLLILGGAPNPPAHSSVRTCCHHRVSCQPFPSKAWVIHLHRRADPPPAHGWRRRGRMREHRFSIPLAAARLGAHMHGPTKAALLQGHELNSARLLPEISEVSNRGDALLTADTTGKCLLVLSPKQPGVTAGCSSFSHLDRSLLNLQHQLKAKSVLAPLHLPLDTTALCLISNYSGQP